MNVYQVPVPSLGSKNMNLCCSWRMGGQKTYCLYVLESSEVCIHSELSCTYFGVPQRIARLLQKDDLCHNRQHYHPQKGLIMIQGSEELLRNYTIL